MDPPQHVVTGLGPTSTETTETDLVDLNSELLDLKLARLDLHAYHLLSVFLFSFGNSVT